jgi:predicted MFS family arabinose efflux permease
LPPEFKRLAGANWAAQSAEQLSLVATPIVAVQALGAGAGEVGLLLTAQTLPYLLLALPLGLLADRRSRRGLMVAAEWLRTGALLGLLLAALTGQISLPLLAVLGFLGALGTVAFSVAAPALVPALVPRSGLAQANGRLELARSLALAGGPALAGALVSWTGASAAFVLGAMLSAAAAVLLLGLREPARELAPARHPLTELREGALWVWRHRLLRPIALTSIVWNTSWFVLQSAYIPYAMRALGLSAAGVGLTLTCQGIGMVLGALLARRIMAAVSYGTALTMGPVLSLLAAACMASTLWWPQPVLAALTFLLFGIGPIVWTISSTTLRQAVTPLPMLGRVSALLLTLNMGIRPLGALLGGAVGAAWGESACLLLALAGFAVQALLIVLSPLRPLQELPAAEAPLAATTS